MTSGATRAACIDIGSGGIDVRPDLRRLVKGRLAALPVDAPLLLEDARP